MILSMWTILFKIHHVFIHKDGIRIHNIIKLSLTNQTHRSKWAGPQDQPNLFIIILQYINNHQVANWVQSGGNKYQQYE